LGLLAENNSAIANAIASNSSLKHLSELHKDDDDNDNETATKKKLAKNLLGKDDEFKSVVNVTQAAESTMKLLLQNITNTGVLHDHSAISSDEEKGKYKDFLRDDCFCF
jgi:hypothetical protein